MNEFVKLYYSDDKIKLKCKGSGIKTLDAIKSVMIDLAKKYDESKYEDGGMMAKGGNTKKEYKVADRVLYAPNGKFNGAKNVSYIKNAEITNVEEISGTKLYTLEIKNKYGQVINKFVTSNIKELQIDPDFEMAKGGMTTFQDKVNAISKRLEGKKVPTRLKKDYGATYDKKEAKEAGQRIAGSMIKKLKMKYK